MAFRFWFKRICLLLLAYMFATIFAYGYARAVDGNTFWFVVPPVPLLLGSCLAAAVFFGTIWYYYDPYYCVNYDEARIANLFTLIFGAILTLPIALTFAAKAIDMGQANWWGWLAKWLYFLRL